MDNTENKTDGDAKLNPPAESNDAPETGSDAPKGAKKEQYVKMSDVRTLIAEALAQQKTSEADAKSRKPKRITEYHAHVWRLDGKWVVDFKDRNTDPYEKRPVHAFQKWNEQLRRFDAWIEIVFHDETTKELPLTTYVANRLLQYLPIIERKKVDMSYVVGEVEKKKEVGDRLVGTGVLVDQEVTMYKEIFKIKLPDVGVFELPDYILA